MYKVLKAILLEQRLHIVMLRRGNDCSQLISACFNAGNKLHKASKRYKTCPNFYAAKWHEHVAACYTRSCPCQKCIYNTKLLRGRYAEAGKPCASQTATGGICNLIGPQRHDESSTCREPHTQKLAKPHLPVRLLVGKSSLQLLPHKGIHRLRNQLGSVFEQGEQLLPLVQHCYCLLLCCNRFCRVLWPQSIVAGVLWESGTACY